MNDFKLLLYCEILVIKISVFYFFGICVMFFSYIFDMFVKWMNVLRLVVGGECCVEVCVVLCFILIGFLKL